MKWENLTLKGALAFYLISVSALMVFFWMASVFLFNATIDAGMAALLASFLTMFIKMAADASGYQYNSSAGSQAKDEKQSELIKQMAPTGTGAGGAPAVIAAATVAAVEAAKAVAPAAAAEAAPAAAAAAAPAAAAEAAPPAAAEAAPPAAETAVAAELDERGFTKPKE